MSKVSEPRVCDEWAYWVMTRKFYAPPVAKNILLALQQRPTGLPPNADLNAAMVYYNMAVNSIPPLDIAAWLVKTFNLKVYRNRKDAIYRLGFNNGAMFYKRVEVVDTQINKRYNQIRANAEDSERQAQGVQVTYKRAETVD